MKNFFNLKITSLKSISGTKIPGRPDILITLIFLFIISVNYFYWNGSSIFFYQEKRSLFIYTFDYLHKYLVKPGGLLEYAGIFFTQFYYNPLYGSLLISVVFILFSIVLIQINERLSLAGSYSIFLTLFPLCLLILLQKGHDHLMYINLGYLLVALWFLLTVFLDQRQLSLLVLSLFPVFYYLVGSFTLIYLGICIIYYIFYKTGIRKFLSPVSIIFVALITFLIFKEILFLQPADRLIGYPLRAGDFSGLPFSLNLLNGYLILFPVIIKTGSCIHVRNELKGLIRSAMVLTLFILTSVLLFKKNNPVFENTINLDRMVYSQDWDAIIEKYENSASANEIEQYYYNLALSEKGQLCDRLFFGPQEHGVESLALSRDYQFLDRSVYFYYTTGLISEVHHLAVESMVINGYRPENIKLLIKTELINGNFQVAERFINILKKTLHYREWAEYYQKMIHDPSLVTKDTELGKKIKLLPGMDFFVMFNDLQNIELLLVSNPANKIAFEYKIARLLFEKDLEAVVAEVMKMKELGYNHIPKHIEESVLEFGNKVNEMPDLGGLTISAETEIRFKQYKETFDLYKRDDQSSLKEKMKNEWGNTFWYYYQFR